MKFSERCPGCGTQGERKESVVTARGYVEVVFRCVLGLPKCRVKAFVATVNEMRVV